MFPPIAIKNGISVDKNCNLLPLITDKIIRLCTNKIIVINTPFIIMVLVVFPFTLSKIIGRFRKIFIVEYNKAFTSEFRDKLTLKSTAKFGLMSDTTTILTSTMGKRIKPTILAFFSPLLDSKTTTISASVEYKGTPLIGFINSNSPSITDAITQDDKKQHIYTEILINLSP